MLLYEAYQAQRDLTALTTSAAAVTAKALFGLAPHTPDPRVLRWGGAACEMLSRGRLSHDRPDFSIHTIPVDGLPVDVVEEVTDATPFCTLLHFAKEGVTDQPRVLVVAPLAGHFSTLMRPTISSLLPDFDVYVTDWRNGRDVATTAGGFGLDDYVEHLTRFLRALGSAHLLAVCQPCPAALVATAVMSEAGDPAVPKSLTLMAGPIDTRISPTAVNQLAVQRPLSWFEHNVITTVPARYTGGGRRVYPGFLQLNGFMAMNLDRHIDRHLSLFFDLASGDAVGAGVTKTFYDEYMAVLDIPAEFYLQTVDAVFQRHLLPRGMFEWRGRPVDPAAITSTALLTVEGENDDVCGAGQTMAAQELCPNIPAERRARHLQPGVGHYGVFSGRLWENQIRPVVRDFISAHD